MCIRDRFKTVADPFVGKLSFVKVVSGAITLESQLVNTVSGQSEKPGKLLLVRGKKQEDVKNISAGDIGALTKLNAQTGDCLLYTSNSKAAGNCCQTGR